MRSRRRWRRLSRLTRGRRLRGIVVAVALLTTACSTEAAQSSPEPTATSTSSAPAEEAIDLVRLTAGAPIVFHPSRLPAGMELCSAPLGNPIYVPDQFCDPDDRNRWIEITILETTRPGGELVTGHSNITELRRAPPIVGVAVGDAAGILLEAGGISFADLVDIASSIPLAEPPDPADEASVLVNEAHLASVVGSSLAEADFREDAAGGWQVFAPNINLYTTPRFEGDADWSFSIGLVRARLLSRDHTMVFGGIAGGQQYATERSAAEWVQGGRYWHLSYSGPASALLERLPAIEQSIRELPAG